MGKAIPGYGAAQGGDDRVLANQLGESLRAETPIEGAVIGLGGGVGGRGHRRLGCGHERPTVHRLGSG